MPNIKSAMKRVKVTETKTLRNSMIKSALKTSIKKSKEAISKNESNSADVLKNAIMAIDKSVAKNILHKNTAARKKSKLVKSFNALSVVAK